MKEQEKTILVIDDTKANIDLLIELLDNYDLIISLDGSNGIKQAYSQHVDLILLDIIMPDMDGFEVCKLLKDDPRTKNIPVIFITAKNNVEDITKGFELGAVDYITKPFNYKELQARISTHIELAGLQQDLKYKVALEIEKNKEKELILAHKSKLASMGEMIDSIAHQWKQPLNLIQIKNDILLFDFHAQKAIDEKYIAQFHKYIKNQVSLMNDTLDEFRNFFRPSQNKIYFNIKNSLKSVLCIIKDDIEKNNINIELIEKNTVDLYLAENELKHVFINLINNAKDAFNLNNIENRKIVLTIDKQDLNAVITVKDNAGGIPQNIIGNIFDINFTTKEKAGGSGMGLYISDMIIKKLKGHIEVKNGDTGAVFTITLPMEEER